MVRGDVRGLGCRIRNVAGLLLVAAPVSAATLTRGPYLQLLTRTGVTIVWNTDAPAACSVAIRGVGGATTIVAGGSGTVCAVPVTGLQPGTSYGYTPRADGLALTAETVFHTDDPARPFTMLVLGDSGTGRLPQLAVADRMLASPADLALHTGDMVYDVGAAAAFDPTFFDPYAALIRGLVFWPTLGNHDVKTAVGAPWLDAFWTPANNAAGSEKYYSFDVGNTHVAVLDSNSRTSPGSAQYTFLDADLAASGARWKVVAFHHTIYSSGSHGSNATIQANLVPLFDARAVDVVFMGHDHDYERTLPLRGGQVVPAGQGTVYVTTGGGGRELTAVGTSSFTAHAEAGFHFTRASVDGDLLLLQMIRVDGSIGDWTTLVKGPGVPNATCGDGLVNQAGETCDGADRTACMGSCQSDCTCAPVCGDGAVNQASEACDGNADAACPGLCRADCTCGTPSEFVILAPIADTYIEAGTEAGWDHGAATFFDVDAKPTGIAYLKFDVSGVPAEVVSARLTLHCTNSTIDGGSVYPVGSSGWIEGDRTGTSSSSAGGPGLKWTDVDTNADGVIDGLDTSPFVPDFVHGIRMLGVVTSRKSVTVDLTEAFRSGPGLYTIAIRNDSSDGATYVSREGTAASQRPQLRLQLGGPLAGSTTTSSTTTISSSSSSTTTSSSTSSSSTSSSSTSSSRTISSTSSTSTTSSTSSTVLTTITTTLPASSSSTYQAGVRA